VNDEPQQQPQQPSEEELRAQLEEQLKQLRVEDVLLQTVVTIVNLTGRKLTVEDEKDIEQAKVGIEAVRALLPLCPEEQAAPVKDALSQLQMLFARESQQPGQPQEPDQPQQPQRPQQSDPEQAEREKARSKLWTPPGTS
jgi:hypothetical protein